MGCTACAEPQCLYKGAPYLYLLVLWSRKSRAIRLLSLWAVRPVQSLSACKERPGRDSDPSAPSSAMVKKVWSYTSTSPMGRTACTEPQCLTTVHFTFTFTSTPLMDLTVCKEHQCLYNVALFLYIYLYSPYGPYGFYRASVPVQRCTLPLPIPLLPLWTVQTVQSLSACTTVHFTFTYTSILPMDRTACTEPQCLYNGAL